MDKIKLRLFIRGRSPISQKAVKNLKKIFGEKHSELFDLDIIDILEHTHLADELKIIATPTLVKLSPEPVIRIIGDFSDKEKVLHGLNIR